MRILCAALFLSFFTASAIACGVDSDCQLGTRTYRIYLPEERQGAEPIGAIIFAHGYRGTAEGTMQNKSLLQLADELGIALVAAQARGTGWHIPGRPRETGNTGLEEYNYFGAIIDDIAGRYDIDREKIMASGFSSGGMMIWELACKRGDLFMGFAPISGTFWSPVPPTCPSNPVNLIHYHGLSDQVVPLAGRKIADSSQGDVQKALTLFIERGNFGPAEMKADDGMNCEIRRNPQGKLLEFCTHPGGHSFRTEFLKRAWMEFNNMKG